MNRAYRACRNSCGGKFCADSDGSENRADASKCERDVDSVRLAPTFISSLDFVRTELLYLLHPLWRKFSHQLEWILSRCRNELGCVCGPFEVFALGFVLCLGFTITKVMALSEPVDEASLTPTWTDLKCAPK